MDLPKSNCKDKKMNAYRARIVPQFQCEKTRRNFQGSSAISGDFLIACAIALVIWVIDIVLVVIQVPVLIIPSIA